MADFISSAFGGGLPAYGGASSYGGGMLSPQQNLDSLMELYNSPIGQDYRNAVLETNALNVKQILAQIENQRQQLALQRGAQAANQWAQQQQIKLAQAAHELAVKTLETNATGYYNGQPTLSREQMMADLTGMYNGSPTWARQYQTAGLTGMLDGTPTLPFRQFEAGTTGYYNGAPTFARQQFEAGTTGYYNGNPTFAREQSAADVALRAAQLGASLRGPRDWASYIGAMGNVANSPAAALARSAPSGLGQVVGNYQTSTPTVASVLSDAGLGAGGAGGGAPAGANAFNGPEWAQVRGYVTNPQSAPGGFWESKSEDEKNFLRGIMESAWGQSPNTFETRYAGSRVNQGNPLAA